MSRCWILSDDSAGTLDATAVIVLYGISPGESPAFRSLLESRSNLPIGQGRVDIVLWDNSQSRAANLQLPDNVSYCHDARNLGLANAYNKSLEIAAHRGSQWLITLDQDTTVPLNFLADMANAACESSSEAGVAAIVPQISVAKKQLSPNYYLLGALPNWFRQGYRGIPGQPVYAFNSGAMVRVDVIKQIGGYDPLFPLDHSDAAMFHRLHEHGKRIFVEGGVQLQHEFSMVDMNRRMSAGRYRNSLVSESAFWDLHMNRLAGCERTARLALRMIRHWQRGHRRELRRITRQFLFVRLFHSKEARLRKWRELLDEKGVSRDGFDRANKPRLKVSVCMAAFNGGKYIGAQLKSILSQLDESDEIVIVDDCSRDDTLARAVELNDGRIRLFIHEKNEGVVATFEDALRSATGDILFLCDDDDLWAPDKVRQVLEAFNSNPDVQIVMSRSALIDEHGERLPDASVNRHGKFRQGFWNNVFVNHYQGSAMAIRASLLGKVLPFPRNRLFLHDAWIGTRCEAAGGKTAFIDQPLLYYRRHSQNASVTHRPWRKIQVRIQLLMAHLSHACQLTFL
jgi:GT2 family glycosyltransferase